MLPIASCCDTVTCSSACTSSGDSAEHTARWRTEQCRQSSVAQDGAAGSLVAGGAPEGRDMLRGRIAGGGGLYDTSSGRWTPYLRLSDAGR
ncbi:hypothetical protein BN1263220010 [Stenotrophomonas indicatrix]|nr:hypothetical protein BN1263220010 [Stenotrophomonas indicatrix]